MEEALKETLLHQVELARFGVQKWFSKYEAARHDNRRLLFNQGIWESTVAELEDENKMLRAKIAALEERIESPPSLNRNEPEPPVLELSSQDKDLEIKNLILKVKRLTIDRDALIAANQKLANRIKQ